MIAAQILYLIIGLVCGPVVFLQVHRKFLESPGRKETDILLVKSPNKFDLLDIVFLVLSLLLKYIRTPLGLSASLTPSRAHAQRISLPHIRLSGLLNIDDADIARFNAAIKAESSTPDDSATLNPLFLSAITGSLVIYLLALPACPIKPLGAVNTRNKITLLPSKGQPDAVIAQDPTALLAASKSGRLSYSVLFGGPDHSGKRTKRGMEFTVRIEILHESVQPLFSGPQIAMVQELTYLQFLSRETLPHYSATIASKAGDVESEQTIDADALLRSQQHGRVLKIEQRDPRKWAACNKDYNPIHMSGLAARMFGQSGVIAHGMHIVALALEEISNQDGANETTAGGPRLGHGQTQRSLTHGLVVDMRFFKPINLPISVQLMELESERGLDRQIVVVRDKRVYTWFKCTQLEG